MRAYIAFTKKEIYELAKTYKLLLLIIVFLIFGFMNPIVAKLTPDIMKSLVEQGISISLPEPTILDSWAQFFKNVSQMGLIVLVIMFSGIISNELSKGTLVNMLTKGLSRKTVILSKFTSTCLIWTLAYFLSALVTFLYSMLFWEDTEVANLLFSISIVWIFGIFLISAVILGGILFKTSYGAMLFCGVIVACLLFLNIFPKVAEYNPIQLISVNMDILKENIEISEVIKPIGVTLGASILFMISSIVIFCKREF
ncbi:ABC transporter permease [Intestinibacter sp.]